jgi:hypothetical protein
MLVCGLAALAALTLSPHGGSTAAASPASRVAGTISTRLVLERFVTVGRRVVGRGTVVSKWRDMHGITTVKRKHFRDVHAGAGDDLPAGRRWRRQCGDEGSSEHAGRRMPGAPPHPRTTPSRPSWPGGRSQQDCRGPDRDPRNAARGHLLPARSTATAAATCAGANRGVSSTRPRVVLGRRRGVDYCSRAASSPPFSSSRSRRNRVSSAARASPEGRSGVCSSESTRCSSSST